MKPAKDIWALLKESAKKDCLNEAKDAYDLFLDHCDYWNEAPLPLDYFITGEMLKCLPLQK